MARSAAISGHPGFTTTHFGTCSRCTRTLTPTDPSCECGALIVQVRLQPKQSLLLDWVLATGPGVPTQLAQLGARAAGKSRGGRDIALIVASHVAQVHPGIRIYIFRRNWTQVKDTHLAKYKLERPELTRFYSDKEYEFPDSMRNPQIAFNFADTMEDIVRITYGPEGFLIIVDQAEQLDEAALKALKAANRWPEVGNNACKLLYLGNPGGPGSDYLDRVFVRKEYDGRENPDDFAFVEAFGWDNAIWFMNQGIEINGEPLTWELFYKLPGDLPICDDGLYSNKWIMSLPEDNRFRLFVTKTSEGKKMLQYPDAIRNGWLFGKFDSFEGQYFNCWNKDRVVLR